MASDKIKPLPPSVISQIKSSLSITSLYGTILGLVENSLDAGASRIDVSLSFHRGNCIVEDDGQGIHPDEFSTSGGLGMRYHSSKYAVSEPVHGCQGEFLSSLASLCLLTITSRHHLYRSWNSIAFHKSMVINRLTPLLNHEMQSNHHGTKVVVRDLFGNMPVRVKQRAQLEENTLERTRLWDELIAGIVALILSWKQAVLVKIVELDSNITLSLGQNTPFALSREPRQDLKSPQDLPTKMTLLCNQAGFFDGLDSSLWVPASASSHDMSVKGLIGLTPVATKRIQFISFGVQPLKRNHGFRELYDEVNQLFKTSDFGAVNGELLSVQDQKNSKNQREFAETPHKDTSHGRKSVERWPAFYLQISLKIYDASFPTNPIREIDVLSRCIEVLSALVNAWLLKHHFRPRKQSSRGSKGTPTKEQLTTAVTENAIIENMTNYVAAPPSQPLAQYNCNHRGQIALVSMRNTSALANDQDDTATVSASVEHNAPFSGSTYASSAPNTVTSDGDETFSWTDPFTHQNFAMNAGTGVAVNSLGDTCNNWTQSRLTIREARQGAASESSSPTPPWMDAISKTWKNPVFGNAEEPIARADHGKGSNELREYQLPLFDRSDAKAVNQFHDCISLDSTTKLSKSSLLESSVITQVNRQFLLLSIPSAAESKVLVAVDQHAADERCRFEQLLGELFLPPEASTALEKEFGVRPSVQYTELPKPLLFQLPASEIRHFEQQRQYFAYWGILYHTSKKTDSGRETTGHLTVKSLPKIIAERARSEPQIVISLLRKEMWNNAETGTRSIAVDPADSDDESSKTWLRRLGHCPKGIMGLISSRACRSAIMFNDALSKDECKSLVGRLAHCAFPFQCAHGRPSMIPLIQVASVISDPVTNVSFAEQFRRWKEKESSE
jgi:DNA mismatch repair protein MLH3